MTSVRERRRDVTYRGRLCGACLRTSWHPDDVRSGYCGACHTWTPGVTVAIPDRALTGPAVDLLAAARALATP